MNMISSFLHPEDAYKNAMNEAEQGWGQAQGYMRPYYDQGQEQYGGLNEARQRLMNPMDLQNEWAQGYETSPYAKRMLDLNQEQGMEAASAMGIPNSTAALRNIQLGAGDIVSKDRQQFLNDLMQKYLAGIGLGENIYGVGANMGQALGQGAMTQGQNMAGLSYGRNAAPGQLFGNMLAKGTEMGANYMMPGGGMANVWKGLGTQPINKYNISLGQ